MPKANRSVVASILLLPLALLVAAPSARSQDFIMTVQSPLNPSSLEPGGGDAVGAISLTPSSGFSGSVSLSCAVTPVQATSPPTCTVSPQTVMPPGNPSVTISISSTTPPGSYVATVTGMGGTTTAQVSLTFAVLTVTPGYTLTVTNAVTPASVHAGSGATATITLTPVNGYTGNVTLSCSAITPVVTLAPSCSFAPNPVVISGAIAQPSTLTITTIGTQSSIPRPRVFYALLLPLPAFVIIAAGLGPAGVLRSRFVSFILLGLLAMGLFLLPACSHYNSTSSTGNGNVTPKNTYSFTLSAIDSNSVAASNGTQTVSLTVD